MNNVFSQFHRAAIVTGLAACSASPAFAQSTIYSSIGPAQTFGPGSVQFGINPGTGYGDEFTSPVTATVGSASLPLQALNPGTTLELTIRSNSANGPHGIVGSFNSTTVPTTAGLVTFEATSGFQLDAGVRYWVTATMASGQVTWFYNDQSIDNFTAFLLGGNWNVDQVAFAGLAIDVAEVPEPASLALAAVGLMVCLARRRAVWKRPMKEN